MLVDHTGGMMSSFSYTVLLLAGHPLCYNGIGNRLTICTILGKIPLILTRKELMKNVTVKDYQAEINRKLCAANITRDLTAKRKRNKILFLLNLY